MTHARRKSCLMACLVVALATASGEAVACPSCKEALANDGKSGNAARLAEGYSWSILLMMAAPPTLLGVGAFSIVRSARRGLIPEL